MDGWIQFIQSFANTVVFISVGSGQWEVLGAHGAGNNTLTAIFTIMSSM